MSRSCSICTHQDRPAIEAALAAGTSVRRIASRFGLSKSSVARHAASHVPAVRPKRLGSVRPDQGGPAAPEHPEVTKTYRCPRYPRFSIATRIVFDDGVFATTDPHLQQLVEIHPWFGRAVFLDGVEHGPRRERNEDWAE